MEKLNLQGDNMEGVRIIDVAQNCIAVLPHDSEYLALSYVWGEAEYSKEDFQMPHCNVALLEKPESLTRIKLSFTISDACEVCTQLGYRYL
jgi:hypothetical protein